MLKKKVNQYIENEHLLVTSDKVLVALSGGADSVALLCVLQELGYSCRALHCNFHLRGSESDRDEAFVRNLCAEKNIPLTVTHFDTSAYATAHKVSIEMAARELRYQFFETERINQHAQAIAVAHHRDDNAETLLLNLIRGTGINGLRGIRPRNGFIVRPLLVVSRDEILAYLKQINQSYVTDSTNLCDDYIRNKIRLNLLPLMTQINPSVKETLASTASRLADVAKIYNQAVHQVKERITSLSDNGCFCINIEAWKKCEARRSLLYELLSSYGFNTAQIDDIYNSAWKEPGRRFMSVTHELLRDRESWIVYPIETNRSSVPPLQIVEREGTCAFPDRTGDLTWNVMGREQLHSIPKDKSYACLDAGLINFPLFLRRTEPGDKFIPFGMKGKKLLSDYMTDRKMSVYQKKHQWVLCCQSDIIWVVGERIDNRYCVTEKTKEVLCLVINR